MEKDFYTTINEKIKQSARESGMSEEEINERIKQNVMSWPVTDADAALIASVIAKNNKKVDYSPLFWPGKLNTSETDQTISESTFTNMSAIEKLVGGENDAEERAEKNMLSVLTSFCGADFVIVVDGKVNGEIEALHLDSLDKGKEVKIDVAIFSNMHENTLSTLKDSKIQQVFGNEYGYSLIREFNNVSFVGEQTSISVDSITPTIRYVYSCESYTNFRLPTDSEEISRILGTVGK